MKRNLSVLVVCVLLGAGTALAAPPRVLNLHPALRITDPPVLDGKLDDPCWRNLPQLTTWYNFYKMTPEPSSLRTILQVGYGPEGVYLGMQMFEEHMSSIKATITTRDASDLWTDDCAEIYLDHAGSAISFRKFVVNALATRHELYQMDPANVDTAWSPDGWRAATSRDDEAWYMELFFPWGNLGATASDGDLWRFAVCRFSWSSKRCSNTAPGARYANPERFGWLLFVRSAKMDYGAVAEMLKARVAGDWLLPLGDKALLKEGDSVQVTTMPELLASMKTRAQSQLAECRRLAGDHAETLKGCDEVAVGLGAMPDQVPDAAVFQVHVKTIQDVSRRLEDMKYSSLVRELLRKVKERP